MSNASTGNQYEVCGALQSKRGAFRWVVYIREVQPAGACVSMKFVLDENRQSFRDYVANYKILPARIFDLRFNPILVVENFKYHI